MSFKAEWLLPTFAYSSWIRQRDVSNEAWCSLCSVVIKLSHNGAYSLKSHAEGKKHSEKLRTQQGTQRITSFLRAPGAPSAATTVGPSTSDTHTAVTSTLLDLAVVPNSVRDAEIIWVLREVQHHHSMNSNQNTVPVLRKMDPDSLVFNHVKFSLSPTKVAYTIAFGIFPCVQKKLTEKINGADCFAICVDETVNKKLKKNQMDFVVRYYDKTADGGGQVETVYFTSKFLGHAHADDLVENFTHGLNGLKIENLLQIGMDGPYVNLNFRRMFTDEHLEQRQRGLLDIGVCALHTLHNAFKAGSEATTWQVELSLSSFHKLFINSPSRREDFEDINGDDEFALKFCETRWLANKICAERILKVLPAFRAYVKSVTSAKSEPKSFYYDAVKAAVHDLLFEAKLHFFISVATDMEPFLRAFQGEEPLAPFLFEDLVRVLRHLLERFVSDATLDNIGRSTMQKLHEVDWKNGAIFKTIDIGTAAKERLDHLSAEPLAAGKLLPFRAECKKFLIAVVDKIRERSPLAKGSAERPLPCNMNSTYLLVRGLSALSPKIISSTSNEALKQRFQVCVDALFRVNALSSADADEAKRQYSQLLQLGVGEFSREQQRLDHFWRSEIGSDVAFAEHWRVFRMLLILSHGQAKVESGFSVNEDMLKDNMGDLCVISQRSVWAWIQRSGGAENCEIDDDLRKCVRLSNKRWKDSLEAKKTNEEKAKKADERKKKKEVDSMRDLQEKRKRIMKDNRDRLAGIEEEIAKKRAKLSRCKK